MKKSSSDSHFRSYTLAATATAALVGGYNAEAVTVVNDNLGLGWNALAPANGSFLSLNLAGQVLTDGTSVADEQFVFYHTKIGSGPSAIDTVGIRGGSGLSGTAPNPMVNLAPLGEGATIGPSSNTPNMADATLGGKFPPPYPGPPTPAGPWYPGQRGYLGLQFKDGDNVHYGWADISMAGTIGSISAVNLHSFAYETEPGQSITTPTTVPEASSIVLMALGAGGVLALRRRRQAAGK